MRIFKSSLNIIWRQRFDVSFNSGPSPYWEHCVRNFSRTLKNHLWQFNHIDKTNWCVEYQRPEVNRAASEAAWKNSPILVQVSFYDLAQPTETKNYKFFLINLSNGIYICHFWGEKKFHQKKIFRNFRPKKFFFHT